VLIHTELLLTLAYLARPDVTPTAIRYYVYPFVWINVGIWAVVRTYRAVGTGGSASASSRHRRTVAGALAAGYFLVLAYAGGLVGPGLGEFATGFRIATLSPGFGPALIYGGETVRLTLLPFKLIGYLALAYLVYATVLDAARSAVGGALGLLSCVSCTWPVLASLVGGTLGGGAAAGAVMSQSYGLSTAVFVLTVGLLYWRPFGRR
jgi:hypothetical protein